ncbi:hypothetical protein HZB96_03485, partial [Candidatus Gottesmanbacteria bacterium]|nr:hypothetical protein [Candidatus Gottesmanbacteria bacterium]
MPEDVRSRYQAQILELQAELKVLAGETRAYVTERKQEEVGASQDEGNAEIRKEQDLTEMESAEKEYVEQNTAKMEGLDARYLDESTNAQYVQRQIEDFVKTSGLQHENVPELVGQAFNAESRRIIGERVQKHIDTLLNSEQGRKNPEKHKTVTELTNRYLDLMTQAQAEGDLPVNLEAQTALRLVEQNVWTLAFQDRVASENLLGDHGIRHLNYDITS